MMCVTKFMKCHGRRSCFLLQRFMSLNRKTFEFKSEPFDKLQQPQYDLEYYCNSNNKLEIEDNIKKRKSTANIDRVLKLSEQLNELNKDSDDYITIKNKLLREVGKMPNRLDSTITDLVESRLIKNVGVKNEFRFKPKEFLDISRYLRVARSDNLSKFTNHRSYFFLGQLAELEAALIKYTLKILLSKNFQLISVPDIINKHVIECCGMDTEGERTQVYSLDEMYGEDLCLSGTAEMAIAGYFMNKTLSISELPVRLAAVSRCFRAETSRVSEERGIYRVHQFTKVEMFGLALPKRSDELLEEFREIEESLFGSLGLYLQTLDMAPVDLGNQASKKYDIEAWMPGRKLFGEVSSCSNCTDYQSRRLNIKTGEEFVHTINGTACAIPRLVIAILETHQNKDGTVNIPTVLHPYMGGETLIKVNNNVPKMKGYRSSNKN